MLKFPVIDILQMAGLSKSVYLCFPRTMSCPGPRLIAQQGGEKLLVDISSAKRFLLAENVQESNDLEEHFASPLTRSNACPARGSIVYVLTG